MFNCGIPVATVCPVLNRMRLRLETIPAGFTSGKALSLKNHKDSSGSGSVGSDLPCKADLSPASRHL